MLRGPDHIIGERDILRGHDQNKIGICLLRELESLLGKVTGRHFMYLVLDIVLNEIPDRKIKVDLRLLDEVLICRYRNEHVYLRFKILAHVDSHLDLLLVLLLEIDREYDIVILLLVRRRILNNYERNSRLHNNLQRPAAGKLLHALHPVRTHDN